ncbi:sporulation protein YpjB [Salibacterium halotolerans]|uniref:Sporulation protein YpjB n=1 Tax=Salibacterium halotolerans TaxID=1884432 RepID=A0A1I5Q811_9BACI|nr:sporulation protein YpjB [Salibacterium halotolerans]SFP42375.1 sporulation protein YpjB [Salibacterium halotolerans]
MTSIITGRRAACIISAAAVILMFFHTHHLQAETDDILPLEKVDDKAAAMHDLAVNGEFEEAKAVHSWIAGRLPEVSFNDYDMNTAQLTALLRAFDRAGTALVDADMDEAERVRFILAFRLAVDAAVHSKNPIWKDYARSLSERLETLKENLQKGNTQDAEQLFHEWQTGFEIIRPAMYTSEMEEDYMPLVSYIRYLDGENWAHSGQVPRIETLQQYITDVVENHRKDGADPSLWAVILSIGSILFASLTYTGWKKYKGEKEHDRMRDK